MTDVFISYSRANQERVALLAEMVTREGYSVWWDAELPPHRSYGDVITEKIASAKAAIVVWSETAADSEWVRAEADLARNQKKLIQASLDNILPPMPFNQIQFAYIGDWNGDANHVGWRKLKASLSDLCGRESTAAPLSPPRSHAPPPPPPEPSPAAPARSGMLMPALAGGALVAIGIAGFLVWNGQKDGGDVVSAPLNTAVDVPNASIAAVDQPSSPTPDMARYDMAAMIDDPDGFTNVRASPSASAPIVARVTKSEAFTTFQQSGTWWRVRTADGRTGWMSRKLIRPLDGSVPPPAPSETADASGQYDTAAAISDPEPGFTNMRAGPGIRHPIVGKIDRDEPFTTYRQSGGWWQVRKSDGTTGWMSRRMIRLSGEGSASADDSKL